MAKKERTAAEKLSRLFMVCLILVGCCDLGLHVLGLSSVATTNELLIIMVGVIMADFTVGLCVFLNQLIIGIDRVLKEVSDKTS